MANIIKALLKGRNAEDLTTTEAKALISEFYEIIIIASLGIKSEKLEVMAHEALEEVGLGLLDTALAGK